MCHSSLCKLSPISSWRIYKLMRNWTQSGHQNIQYFDWSLNYRISSLVISSIAFNKVKFAPLGVALTPKLFTDFFQISSQWYCNTMLLRVFASKLTWSSFHSNWNSSILSLETTELTEKTYGDFKFHKFADLIFVQTGLPAKTNCLKPNSYIWLLPRDSR